MKAELSKWIPASLHKHFKTALEAKSLKVYMEGEERDTNKHNEWIELRCDGPYFRARDAGTWEARIEYNVLVSSSAKLNIYRINEVCGFVAEAFKRHIAILRLGKLPADDGSVFGCMRAIEGNREWLKISHFGIIETAVAMKQSTVEAAYEMQYDFRE